MNVYSNFDSGQPIADLILPDGYYRSWQRGYFMNAYPVSDFTTDRLATWFRFLGKGSNKIIQNSLK